MFGAQNFGFRASGPSNNVAAEESDEDRANSYFGSLIETMLSHQTVQTDLKPELSIVSPR